MKGEICDLNIFSEVKEQLTTRQVAESYGLRIRKMVLPAVHSMMTDMMKQRMRG